LAGKKEAIHVTTELDLPERGTGRRIGTAGSYRFGQPRTEAERLERHQTVKPTLLEWLNSLSTLEKIFLTLSVISASAGIISIILTIKKP